MALLDFLKNKEDAKKARKPEKKTEKTPAKVLIAPAMNEVMYNNKITQSNIAKLKSCGYKFIAPHKGVLACGKVGVGCLAEPEDIIKELKKYL